MQLQASELGGKGTRVKLDADCRAASKAMFRVLLNTDGRSVITSCPVLEIDSSLCSMSPL